MKPCKVSQENMDCARQRIRTKLDVLWRYVREGVPAGAFVPKSKNQFRRWEDPQQGLQVIGSPNTMSKGSSPHNTDLIEEFALVLDKLRRATNKSNPKAGDAATKRKLSGEIAQLSSAVKNITVDWHRARDELIHLHRENSRQAKQITDLQAEISKLRAELVAAERRGLRLAKR